MFRNLLYVVLTGSLLGTFGWVARQMPVDSFISKTFSFGGEDAPVASVDPDRAEWVHGTAELLAYVQYYRLDDEQFSTDWLISPHEAEYADSEAFRSPATDLEAGMTRADVRVLMGEPVASTDDHATWTYDAVTVKFEDDLVSGWIVTDDDMSIAQAMRDAMAPLGDPQAADAATVAARMRSMPAPYISGGAARPRGNVRRSGYGYRRPLDSLFDRNASTNRRYYNNYRSPSYLRGTYGTRSRSYYPQRRVSSYNRY